MLLRDKVRNIRVERGVGVLELSRGSGVSRNTIYMFENGDGNISLDKLESILEYLGYKIIIDKHEYFDRK